MWPAHVRMIDKLLKNGSRKAITIMLLMEGLELKMCMVPPVLRSL